MMSDSLLANAVLGWQTIESLWRKYFYGLG